MHHAPCRRCSTSSPFKNDSSSSPFKNDPVDKSFVLRTLHVNPVCMIVREHVLEVRCSMSGKVFVQCKYCAHLLVHERAIQSTVSPQSISKLYCANVRFEYIPQWITGCSPKKSRVDNSGGVKTYWEESAMAMGLRDDVERKCIYSRIAALDAIGGNRF